MNQLNRVEALEQELLGLGYRHYQLDDIYRDAVGTANVNNLDHSQYETLIEAMEETIAFAHKCLRTKIKK